jgi:uncharacterized membrane-anchored protein
MNRFPSHVICLSLLLAVPALHGQNSGAKPDLKFVKGPAKAPLGSVAQLDLPAKFVLLNGKDYRTMLKAQGEPVSGQELAWLSPTNEDWAVVFEFSDIGYVKDDDKDKLDADKLLASIKRGTAEANKTRQRAGHPPIEVVGWEMPPKYDAETHNLEWAIRGSVEGQPILNYNTRLLGRKGVMEVVLIVQPDQLKETLPKFRNLLAGYSYQTGQNYAEYRSGDKIAKIGLGALVLGGAAVGAAKLGLLTGLLVFLKKGWKLVVVGLAALAGGIKKLFSGRKSRPENASGDEPQPGG